MVLSTTLLCLGKHPDSNAQLARNSCGYENTERFGCATIQPGSKGLRSSASRKHRTGCSSVKRRVKTAKQIQLRHPLPKYDSATLNHSSATSYMHKLSQAILNKRHELPAPSSKATFQTEGILAVTKHAGMSTQDVIVALAVTETTLDLRR
ncbi:hypothetical protein CLAIMM_09369 isoform 2, partial [Cladophialophora immunda]